MRSAEVGIPCSSPRQASGGLGKEQGGRGIGAGGDAGTAADAGCGVEGAVGIALGDGHGVGVGSSAGVDGDVAARRDDPVEGAAVHHQVSDHREGGGAPRFDGDGVAVLEGTHVELAGGDPGRAVRLAVDHQSAHAADAFAAVAVEGHGFLAPDGPWWFRLRGTSSLLDCWGNPRSGGCRACRCRGGVDRVGRRHSGSSARTLSLVGGSQVGDAPSHGPHRVCTTLTGSRLSRFGDT